MTGRLPPAGKSLGYRFNPYEVAITGGDRLARRKLAGCLREALRDRWAIALVEIEGNTRESIEPDLRQWPKAPSEGSGPLLDADLVLVATDTPGEMMAISLDHPAGVAADDYGPGSASTLASLGTLDGEERLGRALEALQEYCRVTTAATPLRGLVLAGGASRRMQRDKAGLRYHDTPQLHHARSMLEQHCEEVFVSVRPDQADEGPRAALARIKDSFLDLGPMSGILSAQREFPGGAWLVLACDLPFLDHDTLRFLRERRNPMAYATAFRSSHDGLPEPLCAIWEPKSFRLLLEFLGAGIRCPRKVLIEARATLLEPVDPGALDNINTPDELARARQRLQSGG